MIDDDLREEYRNVEAALTERSIIVPGGDSFHRPGCDGTTPACSAASEKWRVVDTSDAARLGMAPCRNCYWSAVDYLAAEVDDSPVERREEAAAVDTPDTPEADHVVADGGASVATQSPQLNSRTEEVLVTTNGSTTTYHAPAGGDAPLCGTAGSFRCVDRAVLAGQKDACGNCFDTDAIDTSTP